MKLHAYLSFDGRCDEAFKFYEQALGGKIGPVMRHAGTPMAEHVPPEWQDKVMHGQITIADQVVMASDTPPGRYQTPQGISLTLMPASADEAERHFAALAEGGTVGMPLEKTFWAERFGMVTDRFGIPWMINCDLQG